MSKTVYECVAVDVYTKDCTDWQVVESSDVPITRNDFNAVFLAVLSFMVFVWVLNQVKRSI